MKTTRSNCSPIGRGLSCTLLVAVCGFAWLSFPLGCATGGTGGGGSGGGGDQSADDQDAGQTESGQDDLDESSDAIDETVGENSLPELPDADADISCLSHHEFGIVQTIGYREPDEVE